MEGKIMNDTNAGHFEIANKDLKVPTPFSHKVQNSRLLRLQFGQFQIVFILIT